LDSPLFRPCRSAVYPPADSLSPKAGESGKAAPRGSSAQLPAILALPALRADRTPPPPATPTDHLGLSACSHRFRPWRHFPATNEARTHLGPSPSSPTNGLRAHYPLRSLPAIAAFPATDEARTHFGRAAPIGPPSAGHAQRCPLLPLLPLPAD
jgi:hypothetical protein